MATIVTMARQQVVPKISFHELLGMSDIPTTLTRWNIPHSYPGHTSIAWFQISVAVNPDTYLTLGHVLLPGPDWDASEVYNNLCGTYEDMSWCVTQT
jgi:hypothetical protein